MRKNLSFFLAIMLVIAALLQPLSASAASDTNTSLEIIKMDDGSFLEVKTVTKNKKASPAKSKWKYTTLQVTVTSKSKSGVKLWSFTNDAMFKYNGKKAVCTRSLVLAKSHHSDWYIASKSDAEKANKSIVKATAKRTPRKGVPGKKMSRKITIKCSKKGKCTYTYT